MAIIHGATDGITLLTGSSRLVKIAKHWYDYQNGIVIESWIGLRTELVKMFERKVPFYKEIQKIEAKKWNMAKESFDEYAIAKLTQINQLDLSTKDAIHLLIRGIQYSALRATALSTTAETVEQFLEKVRPVMEGAIDFNKKVTPGVKGGKTKDNTSGLC